MSWVAASTEGEEIVGVVAKSYFRQFFLFHETLLEIYLVPTQCRLSCLGACNLSFVMADPSKYPLSPPHNLSITQLVPETTLSTSAIRQPSNPQ